MARRCFIDVAEDTGLIIPMGRWILREVCKQAVVLQELGPESGFEVSINLSVAQLDHPTFVGDVEDAIVDSGIDARLIELEITESALMRDVETSASLLSALKHARHPHRRRRLRHGLLVAAVLCSGFPSTFSRSTRRSWPASKKPTVTAPSSLRSSNWPKHSD